MTPRPAQETIESLRITLQKLEQNLNERRTRLALNARKHDWRWSNISRRIAAKQRLTKDQFCTSRTFALTCDGLTWIIDMGNSRDLRAARQLCPAFSSTLCRITRRCASLSRHRVVCRALPASGTGWHPCLLRMVSSRRFVQRLLDVAHQFHRVTPDGYVRKGLRMVI
jgi:Fe-S-cluster containining protein